MYKKHNHMYIFNKDIIKVTMNENTQQEYAMLIAKKSERLVTALYLVTDLMSDNEPIKHGLRKNGVTLLSSMNALAQLDVKDIVTEFKTSLKAVTETISLLHVASTTGTVSEMNGTMLIEGFRSLQIVLEKKQPILTREMLLVEDEEKLSLDSSFSSAVSSTSYDVLTPLTVARFRENERESRKVEDILTQSKLLNRLGAKDRTGKEIYKGHGYGEMSVTKDKKYSVHSNLIQHVGPAPMTVSSFKVKKQSRREEILALLVPGVDVSIKDISARIKGCSEKTIQRELNALLDANIVERIGEKRWSRYVLKRGIA